MLSGTPRFTCRSGVCLLICFTFFISLGEVRLPAVAQTKRPDLPLHEPPLQRSFPQRNRQRQQRQSASENGLDPSGKGRHNERHGRNDSMMVKLGPGDLI